MRALKARGRARLGKSPTLRIKTGQGPCFHLLRAYDSPILIYASWFGYFCLGMEASIMRYLLISRRAAWLIFLYALCVLGAKASDERGVIRVDSPNDTSHVSDVLSRSVSADGALILALEILDYGVPAGKHSTLLLKCEKAEHGIEIKSRVWVSEMATRKVLEDPSGRILLLGRWSSDQTTGMIGYDKVDFCLLNSNLERLSTGTLPLGGIVFDAAWGSQGALFVLARQVNARDGYSYTLVKTGLFQPAEWTRSFPSGTDRWSLHIAGDKVIISGTAPRARSTAKANDEGLRLFIRVIGFDGKDTAFMEAGESGEKFIGSFPMQGNRIGLLLNTWPEDDDLARSSDYLKDFLADSTIRAYEIDLARAIWSASLVGVFYDFAYHGLEHDGNVHIIGSSASPDFLSSNAKQDNGETPPGAFLAVYGLEGGLKRIRTMGFSEMFSAREICVYQKKILVIGMDSAAVLYDENTRAVPAAGKYLFYTLIDPVSK
jgi:hypothetical protein